MVLRWVEEDYRFQSRGCGDNAFGAIGCPDGFGCHQLALVFELFLRLDSAKLQLVLVLTQRARKAGVAAFGATRDWKKTH